MLLHPLHPAIVHFPIVLAVLLPIATLAGVVAVRRGIGVREAWVPALVLATLLPVSAFAAVRTGEAEEESVEQVVSQAAIHEHEERAEIFLPLTVIGLVVVAAGLMPGRTGVGARWASLAVALAITGAGFFVGHSGGELVYVHGAGQAYAQGGTGTTDDGEWPGLPEEDEEGRQR
jgi:uncharacterized membrane protein